MNDDELERLWKRVVSDWDDPAAHGAFLEHCRAHDALSDAAARYRGMAGDHVRGADAKKRLDAVVMLAFQALEARRSTPPRGFPRWATFVVGLLFGAAALYAVTRALSG